MNDLNNKTSNIPQITISHFVAMENRLICNAVKNGIAVSALPSVYLVGPMGVGKSQGVRELAKKVEENTGRKVNLIDIRLLLFSPVDLRGIPAVNSDKTASQWIIPEVFKLDVSSDVINIIFLDELSSCTPAVQAAAYQIVLDHKIGEHSLPDNTYVIAAGNRIIDKSVVYKMPKALANRLTHFEIVTSVDEWSDWAVNNGIDHRIIGFIAFKNDMLLMTDGSDELAFPTPRTWAAASRYLAIADEEDAFMYLRGCVGTQATEFFSAYCKTYRFLPDIADIFSGNYAPLKKNSLDVLHALSSAMIAYVREHQTSFSEIETSLSYAEKNLPADFLYYLIRGYSAISSDLAESIKSMPAYKRIISRKGSAFNGNI